MMNFERLPVCGTAEAALRHQSIDGSPLSTCPFARTRSLRVKEMTILLWHGESLSDLPAAPGVGDVGTQCRATTNTIPPTHSNCLCALLQYRTSPSGVGTGGASGRRCAILLVMRRRRHVYASYKAHCRLGA